MKKILLFFLLISVKSFSIDLQDETLNFFNKKSSGLYYPHYKMSYDLVKTLPIRAKLKISVNEIRNISLSKNSYFTKIITDIYLSHPIENVNLRADSNDIKEDGDLILGINCFNLNFPEGDDVFFDYAPYITSENLAGYDENYPYHYVHYFEGTLPLKWNLRDYPFDIQKLKLNYSLCEDTSLIRVDSVALFIAESFEFLIDGFSVNSGNVEVKEVYNVIEKYTDSTRQGVFHYVNVVLNLTRSGSFLYFKLFFGAILSLLISSLVFFIDPKEFESRITLCIGSVFGAIGNKYFVESALPEIQVLTKADIVNNIMIILVIINIFLVIGQHNSKIKLGFLQSNLNAAIFSLLLFIVLNLISIFI